MKSAIIFRTMFAILFILMISGISSYAAEPAIAPGQKLQKLISESIKYPQEAVKSCCTGSVDVTFTIADNGTINIVKTFTENPSIEKLVKEQLANISCKDVQAPSYQQYKITITYKLV